MNVMPALILIYYEKSKVCESGKKTGEESR